jgi:hypothetical protein
MTFDVLADAVVVVHLGFILFVAVGALLAWRWRWLVWLHVPAVAWSVGIIAIGWECPLTPLEQWLRRHAGESYEGGFVDRYLEGVVYPEALTPLLRAVAAVLVVIGYAGLFRRRRRRRERPVVTSPPMWR